MSSRRTDSLSGEQYDLPELYMEIFWYYIQRLSPTYNLIHCEGFHLSTKQIFSLVHLVFKRPPPGKTVDPLKAMKTRRESTRRKDSTDIPFRTPAKFDGDKQLLQELEDFAKEICCLADQVLSSTTLEARREELNRSLSERLVLKGDYCWLVVEQTKANEIHPELDHPLDPETDILRKDKDGIDKKGKVHLKVEIRTLQPPHEWLERYGKYAKWEGGAEGRLRLRWWTGSVHKEEVSIDDTWTMVSDFEGA